MSVTNGPNADSIPRNINRNIMYLLPKISFVLTIFLYFEEYFSPLSIKNDWAKIVMTNRERNSDAKLAAAYVT